MWNQTNIFLKPQGYRPSKCGFMGLQHSMEVSYGRGVPMSMCLKVIILIPFDSIFGMSLTILQSIPDHFMDSFGIIYAIFIYLIPFDSILLTKCCLTIPTSMQHTWPNSDGKTAFPVWWFHSFTMRKSIWLILTFLQRNTHLKPHLNQNLSHLYDIYICMYNVYVILSH